jgi:N-acetylmuramoyl-L-alanine amidase
MSRPLRLRFRHRRDWNAVPPKTVPTRDDWSRGVTLVVHHTVGTAAGRISESRAELLSIQRAHLARGYNDIGYNYLIDRRGVVWAGRGFGVVGAHTLRHNTGTIGVALMGNYVHLKPTRRQRAALRLLVIWLRRRGARITSIRGHREMPGQATECPGTNLMSVLPWWRRKLGVGA